ncbi:MAG: efflux RND transporter permease subunit [Thermodesulfobacteriota bacterium]|nr:efflux RND transporter permease subunit [Thermodesulfobacteriota bacterium]
MKITDFSINKPVTTLTLTAAAIVFGLFSFLNMGIDLFPEVDFPVVTVSTVMSGASPEIVDSDITDVIEEEINTISGIKNIISSSYENLSQIIVEFELEKDVDIAAQEVRDKVSLAHGSLPEDAQDSMVAKFDISSNPIMWVSVSGSVDYGTISNYADKVLKEQLQSVSGVGRIKIGGMREREIRIWLDPQLLKARGLTSLDIVSAIKCKHMEMPGGRVETAERERSIKVQGEYSSVAELRDLVVANRQGAVIRLKDIGRVDDGFEDLRSIGHYNGRPSVGLGIQKQSGTNTTEVAHAIRARIDELAATIPEDINVDIVYDGSEFIENSMHGVLFDILLGIILTALTMFIFLREFSTTFISIMAIPVSIIGAFIVMNALGFTINNMTMLAMTLAVGMVIDDTIVVLENIFRHVEQGMTAMDAASSGTSEVSLAVIAATSSIAAVFLPVAMMKGMMGRFFYQFGLTVALTIIISVMVSLTLTPFLSSRLIRHKKRHNRFYVILGNGLDAVDRAYKIVLEWSLRRRKTVIVIAGAAFIGGLSLIPLLETEMTPASDKGVFKITFEMPTGTSIMKTSARLREIESIIFDMPEVDQSFTSVGLGRQKEGNKGMLLVIMTPKKDREMSQQGLMMRMRNRLAGFNDMVSSVEEMSNLGGGQRNTDIQVVIKGPDLEGLAYVSDRIVADLRGQGCFSDIDTNLRLTKPDIKVKINRDLADDLGVDVQTISSEVYTLFSGMDVGTFKDQGNRYDINIKALPEYRLAPGDIGKISVRSRDGRIIDASNLVSFIQSTGPNVINRYKGMFSVTLYANVRGISKGEGLERTLKTIKDYLPVDGKWDTDLAGSSQHTKEAFESLLQAVMLAIVFIYMILCIQFESFLHPFTMMLSLPLSMVGVFGAILVTGQTLNIMSFIGIIMLMGIVTKNGILLVSFANQQRAAGQDNVQAMLNAGAIRLRPILMTALTVVASLVPVSLGLTEGGEARAPMGVAVIGGMVSSTLLTLIVVPVVYVMLDNLKEGLRKRRLSKRTDAPGREIQGEES